MDEPNAGPQPDPKDLEPRPLRFWFKERGEEPPA